MVGVVEGAECTLRSCCLHRPQLPQLAFNPTCSPCCVLLLPAPPATCTGPAPLVWLPAPGGARRCRLAQVLTLRSPLPLWPFLVSEAVRDREGQVRVQQVSAATDMQPTHPPTPIPALGGSS